MTTPAIFRETHAAASAEMALMLPMLLVLLFGGFEVGYFMWCEHKVVEAVRNGARYAARLPFSEICPAPSTAAATNIKLMTRTGQIDNSSATPLIPGWTLESQVSVSCETFLTSGIYTGTPTGTTKTAVRVKVQNLAYPSLFQSLGVIDSSVNLSASASTAVIGI